MRSDNRLRSAGPSIPSASRSVGESCRKMEGEIKAAAKRGAKRDSPAQRSQAVTCASAIGEDGGGRVQHFGGKGWREEKNVPVTECSEVETWAKEVGRVGE